MEQNIEKPKSCACSHRKCFVIFIGVLLVTGIICYHIHLPSTRSDLPPNTVCKVQFRHDALGAATLDADAINGKGNVSVRGTVVSMNRDAIVLQNGEDKMLWIPMENILLIEYENNK